MVGMVLIDETIKCGTGLERRQGGWVFLGEKKTGCLADLKSG